MASIHVRFLEVFPSPMNRRPGEGGCFDWRAHFTSKEKALGTPVIKGDQI